MPSYVCIIDCEFDEDSRDDALDELAGEHVYELEAPDRAQAERDALAQFHATYPTVEALGPKVDLGVTVRRKASGGTATLTAPRRGRLQVREEPTDEGAEDDEPSTPGDET